MISYIKIRDYAFLKKTKPNKKNWGALLIYKKNMKKKIIPVNEPLIGGEEKNILLKCIRIMKVSSSSFVKNLKKNFKKNQKKICNIGSEWNCGYSVSF